MLINCKNIDKLEDWVDISDLGAILSSKSLPESPNMEIIDSGSISRQKIYLGTSYTHREMEVILAVITQTSEELRLAVNKLTEALKGKFSIIFKDNSSQIYRDVVLSSRIEVEAITNSVYLLTIKMTAYDPFRYGTEVRSIEITDAVSGTEQVVSNLGNHTSRPIITLQGTANKVNITVNGKTLTYVKLQAGNKIVIDNDKYTVVNKQTSQPVNALANWRDNFIELEPGDNTINVSGENVNVDITIEFRDTYL